MHSVLLMALRRCRPALGAGQGAKAGAEVLTNAPNQDVTISRTSRATRELTQLPWNRIWPLPGCRLQSRTRACNLSHEDVAVVTGCTH